MADEFDPSKTEAPTPRRLEKAREEGQVAFSPDLNSAASLLVAAVAAVWVLPHMAWQMCEQIKIRILHLDGSVWNEATTVISMNWLFNQVWVISGGLSMAFLVITLALSKVQTGFLITFKPMDPKFDRMNPVQGFQRLFSFDSVVRGLLSILKVTSFSLIAAMVFWWWNNTLLVSTHGTLNQSIAIGWELIVQLMLWLAGAAFVWGATDYGFRWFRQHQKLKMTLQEIKEEAKDEQGDPHLKARLRRMQKESAQRKTLNDVPKASVVITNPTHYAIALQYVPGEMAAPKILAKGSGAFARRIADKAREHGIPVLERKPLTRALFAIGKVGEEVPLEFYRAIAEILAFVFKAKNNR